jgi:hypothetical protein
MKNSGRTRDAYDPFKKDPGAGKANDERVNEADEQVARQQEGIQMGTSDRLDDSSTSPLIHTGHAGQTTQGQYGFNDSTGQGAYMDRVRDGSVDAGSMEALDNPLRDEEGDQTEAEQNDR